MKAQDIIVHMMEYMPKYTDVFSGVVTPSSVVVSGTTVTMTFATPHGVANNGIVCVKGALIQNPIDTIDDSGDDVVFTTTLDHDITEGYTETVNLTSVSTPAIDGNYPIVTSENRKTFTLASFPGAALGDVVLNEAKEVVTVNGWFSGVTKVSDTVFSYELPAAFPVDPVVKADTVSAVNALRISGGASITRLKKHYEQQKYREVWAFVVLGASTTSKDRNVTDDPTLQQGGSNEWGALLMQSASVFVFVPSKDSSERVLGTGRAARDLIEDIRPQLFKALLGTEFDTGFAQKPSSQLAMVGDDLFEDNTAYIIHQFEFQQVAYVSDDDVVDKSETVAMRDVSIDYLDYFSDSGNIIMEAEIDLDDNPAS